MDSQRFDQLARSLSSGSSRRGFLRGVLGGAAAVAGLRAASTAAAPAEKVTICHYSEDTGDYHQITVSGNALDAHLAHGDHLAVAGCSAGYIPDEAGCACVPAIVCETLNSACGDGGRCVTDVATGSLICADDPTSCVACTAGSCGAGQICAADGNCGFDHCHPVHPV